MLSKAETTAEIPAFMSGTLWPCPPAASDQHQISRKENQDSCDSPRIGPQNVGKTLGASPKDTIQQLPSLFGQQQQN